MKKTLAITALAVAFLAVSPSAFAGSANGTLTVNSSVAANCTISNATLNFGPYDPVVANGATGIDLDAQTTMAVACTKGSSPNITAPAGGAMTGGGDSLNYLLFSNNGRTTDFTGGFAMPAATSKTAQTLTIYGRVVKNQDVTVAALYTGTILITVNF